MRLFRFLRYLSAMIIKGSRYGFDFLKISNRRFCNSSDKIIGWHRGYPSFYLLSPPMLSRPAANSLITRIMSVYQWRKLPDLASIAVTDACNTRCRYCSFTSMKRDAPLLNTGEMKDLIRQCQDLGVVTVNFVGGEPLLREDICDLIKAVDKDLSQAILFTNGYLLKETARDLRRAGLTSVVVSLDSSDPDLHDEKKGLAGLFQRAAEGIREARRQKLLVGISAVVERGDTASGALADIFEMGKRLKVNDILLFDAVPAGNYSDREDLDWTREELDEIISLSAKFHEKRDYPGIHPYTFSKDRRGIGCSGGVSHFYVTPYGDVCPCDFIPLSTGNIKDEPLHVLWDRFSSDVELACTSLDGCRMQSREYRERIKALMVSRR